MDGVFKTAVGGFKKDEVLAYIDKKESEFLEQKNTLEGKIKKLNEKNFEAQKENESLKAQINTQDEKNSIEDGKSSALEQERDEAVKQFKRLKTELDKSNALVLNFKSENGLFRQKIKAAQDETVRARQTAEELKKEVEQLKKQVAEKSENEDKIGRVLIEVQATADRIIDSANEKAAQIINGAKSQMNGLLGQAEQFKDEISKLRGESGNVFTNADDLLGQIEGSAEKIISGYQDAFSVEEKKPEDAENTAAADSEA